MASPQIGELLRTWRTRRRRSQMDLALDVGVSPRHLSFVETGRSRPSPELVLAVAEHLDVPLRERNTMLLAAGYAPRFSQTPLDDPALDQVRGSLQRMLDAHNPYPGVIIDRQWNVLLTNPAADVLMAVVPPAVLTPKPNVFRVCLHPEGLAPITLDFDDWGSYLLRQIRRSIILTGDPELEALEAEVLAYPTVQHLPSASEIGSWDDPPLLVPLRIQLGDDVLSLFTTLTTFGTPRDVTLEELAVELFFPADEHTEALLGGTHTTAASATRA